MGLLHTIWSFPSWQVLAVQDHPPSWPEWKLISELMLFSLEYSPERLQWHIDSDKLIACCYTISDIVSRSPFTDFNPDQAQNDRLFLRCGSEQTFSGWGWPCHCLIVVYLAGYTLLIRTMPNQNLLYRNLLNSTLVNQLPGSAKPYSTKPISGICYTALC